MPRHHVLLVPGFFGFGRLGDIPYFNGVTAALDASFERLGLDVSISEVPTLPTASIRERAARVVESLAAVAAEHDGPIHVIGHSTGGLDARLALTPTASLPARVAFVAHERVQTLVTVSCPHFGTPAALYLLSGAGRRVLKLLARYFVWLLGRGFLLDVTLRGFQVLLALRHPLRRTETTLAQLQQKLLGDLSEGRRRELVDFLKSITNDQALFFQLTPEVCDLINACTANPALRYGSVVTRAPRPTFRRFFSSLRDVYAQLMYPVYAWLYRATSRQESRWIPPPVSEQARRLGEAFGELPAAEDNDGIVPTNSQIWGEVVHATCADHLDVVGQFEAPDWLPSYAGFDQRAFEALWFDVARFIAGHGGEVVGTERTEQDLPPNRQSELT